MLPEPWLYGFAVLLALGHLAAVVYAVRRRGGRQTTATASTSRDGDRTTDSVACPACDAANDPDYRYCRRCVAELPGGALASRSRVAPRGRELP